MSSEILRGLKAPQGKGLLRLLQIGTAALGILAADAGPKPVHAALPEYKAVPMPQLEPGFPSLKELKKLHPEDPHSEATWIRDTIVAIPGRFEREYLKLRPRFDTLLKGLKDTGSSDERLSALVTVVEKELARLESLDRDNASDAKRIQALVTRIRKFDDTFHEFFMMLYFSEQVLGGPEIGGPTRLLNRLSQEAEFRIRAQQAIEEVNAIFGSDTRDLSEAFYRIQLRTLQTLQQAPQPAQPEPKQ